MVVSGQQPLGQLLVEMGFIDAAQLQSALEVQGRSGKRLGKILIDAGVISEDRLVHALSKQLGIEACDPIMTPVHERVLALVPPEMAFRHKVLPVARQREDGGECLYVATSDPLDKRALQAIRTVIPPTTRVRWMLAGETEMELALARHYRPGAGSERGPPGRESRETTRGVPVPTGIPVLQGKPLAAPRGSVPVAPASSPPVAAAAGITGLHAHSSTGDIFNALEQAVLRADPPRPRSAPPPATAILKSTGDLAMPDPARWTGGDLAAPEPILELEPIRLGTKDLAPEPGSFDLPIDLGSSDVPPPPPPELSSAPSFPAPMMFVDEPAGAPPSALPDYAQELLPPPRPVLSAPSGLEEIAEAEVLADSADLPLLHSASASSPAWTPPPPLPTPLPTAEYIEPKLSAPPLPSSPNFPASGPITLETPALVEPSRSSPSAPPPLSKSSPSAAPPPSKSNPALPAFGLSGGSNWGDLLDDAGPGPEPGEPLASSPPLTLEDDPAVLEIEEVDALPPSVQRSEPAPTIETVAPSIEAEAPFVDEAPSSFAPAPEPAQEAAALAEPAPLIDPLPEVPATDVEAIEEDGPLGLGPATDPSMGGHRPIDLPERSPLLDTGEVEAEAPPTSPLPPEEPVRLTPVADFLQMAELAGVSSAPTTIPGPADADEESVELATYAGPLSALGIAEELPDASADVMVDESPELEDDTSALDTRPPTTADLLVGSAKATVARDLVLRFISDEDQTPETQRYVLRLLAAVLLAEGLLDDERLLHALERLR